VVDINFDLLISLLKWYFFLLLLVFGLLFNLDEFPDIVLRNVVGGVGTAGNFIEGFKFLVFDFVSMEVVFCFEVTKNEAIVQ